MKVFKNIVNFFKMENLSPKKAKSLAKETIKEETVVPQTVPANDGMITPTKQICLSKSSIEDADDPS